MRIRYSLLCFVASSRVRPSFGFATAAAATTTKVCQSQIACDISSTAVSSSQVDGTENTMTSEGEKSWRSLLDISIAKTRKTRGSNYVQIATVDETTGEPRCRTIVFRGFLTVGEEHPLSNVCDDKSCLMKMCTDSRSKKVGQVAQQPTAEMVWWFPSLSEQYRIRGKLLMIGHDNPDRSLEIARKELWGNLSDPARESFFGKAVPGETFVEDTPSDVVPAGGRDEDGKVLPPPDNFLLMLLDPHAVDYLLLKGDQHRQIDTRTSSDWSMERVNP